MGISRVMRNTAVSVVVLGVLLVGGGVAYTYFLGPDGTQTADAVQEPAEPKPLQMQAKPVAQDPQAPVSVSVSALSSPAKPGDNAMLTLHTSPLAKCTVTVEYGGAAVKDSGLAPKPADEFGIVSWSWTVAASAPLGTWPVKATCVKGKKSAVVQADQKIEQKSSSKENAQ